MGKIIVAGFAVAILGLTGSILYIRSNLTNYHEKVLSSLDADFRMQGPDFTDILTNKVTISQADSWQFSFRGDELIVTAPSLNKIDENGELQSPDSETFSQVRAGLEKAILNWLSHRPGDSKRFPVRVHFKNES